VLREEVSQDKQRLARFEREAKAVARLAHPNILEIWDYGTDNGKTYAITELLEGETLRQRIPSGGMERQQAWKTARSVAEGLAAAHDRGVVHRDLKPENI
jgi:serine/threonine protein kinase